MVPRRENQVIRMGDVLSAWWNASLDTTLLFVLGVALRVTYGIAVVLLVGQGGLGRCEGG